MARRMARLIVPLGLLVVLLLSAGSAVAQPAGDGLFGDPKPDGVAPSDISLQSVSSRISYQAFLTNSGGAPLNGTHDIVVELWNAGTGGDHLWTGTFDAIPVEDGLVDLVLPVDQEHFDGQALWLALSVDGQALAPRQEILPAPYALSLRPGAEIRGDEEYGLSSYTSGKYGLYGDSSREGDGAGVWGYKTGVGGMGVAGMAAGEDGSGVFGRAMGTNGYGGYFISDQSAGLHAGGADNSVPDVELGGTEEEDDGVLASSMSLPASDLVLVSNEHVIVTLDDNNDDEGEAFVIVNGQGDAVFVVDEWGHVTSRGEIVTKIVLDEENVFPITVPNACLNNLCEITIYMDGNMGAFGPGLMWPVTVFQDIDSDDWYGGPNLAMAGVSFCEGSGHNGDSNTEYIFQGGETTSGGFVRIMDDSLIEHDPYQWTVSFNPVPGELEQAIIFIAPIGTPFEPEPEA